MVVGVIWRIREWSCVPLDDVRLDVAGVGAVRRRAHETPVAEALKIVFSWD